MKKLFPCFCKAFFAIILLITQQQKALSQCFSNFNLAVTTVGTANAGGLMDTSFTTSGSILGNATIGTNRINAQFANNLTEALTVTFYCSRSGSVSANIAVQCYGSTGLLHTASSAINSNNATGIPFNVTIPTGTRTLRISNTSPGTTLYVHIITYPKTPIASAVAQSFCSVTTPTIANLCPAPSAEYRWYDVPTGGTVLSGTTAITTSDTFYVCKVNIFGCEGPRVLVPVYIGIPAVNTISNQTVCNGTSSAAVNFTGTWATNYSWTNNNSSIGLAASGIGNIPSFNATNTGNIPITATISTTPINGPIMAYVANNTTNNVSAVNISSNTVVASIPLGSLKAPASVCTSPDGRKAYVACTGNSGVPGVSIINTATNTVIATVATGSSTGICVSPNGSKVYVTTGNTISVIDTVTNMVSNTIAVGNSPYGICVSLDGSKVYVTNRVSGTVSVINTATNTVSATVTVGTNPEGICVSPDGSKVYVANNGAGTVSVINTANNTVSATITVGTAPRGICISPDGNKVYVANFGNTLISGSVSVINTSTNTVNTTIGVDEFDKDNYNFNCQGVSITPDGRLVYVTNYDLSSAVSGGYLSIINTADNTIITSLTVGDRPNSVGNFITPVAIPTTYCTGTDKTFTITVNPSTDAAIATANTTQTLPVNSITYFSNGCTDNLIAKVNPSGASPVNGSTTAKVWIESTQPSNYAKRHYEMTPAAGATTATGTITLYFTQAEFNDFNAVNTVKLPTGSADASGIANLLIEKRSGVSSDGTGLPGTYTGSIITINPADADIIWNAALNRWEITFDVTGFSGFFVKTQAGILPLRLISFTASKLPNTNVQLQWQANNEVNVNKYEVESSTTGNNFTKIGTVAATNLTNYKLIDNSDWNSEVRFYRLKMIDNDGAFKYSTVVKVSNKQVDGGVSIYPNPVNDVFTIQITDKNILHTTAQLTDVSGKLIRLIPINNSYQNDSVVGLPCGLYILKFADGSSKKVIKE